LVCLSPKNPRDLIFVLGFRPRVGFFLFFFAGGAGNKTLAFVFLGPDFVLSGGGNFWPLASTKGAGGNGGGNNPKKPERNKKNDRDWCFFFYDRKPFRFHMTGGAWGFWAVYTRLWQIWAGDTRDFFLGGRGAPPPRCASADFYLPFNPLCFWGGSAWGGHDIGLVLVPWARFFCQEGDGKPMVVDSLSGVRGVLREQCFFTGHEESFRHIVIALRPAQRGCNGLFFRRVYLLEQGLKSGA